MSDTPRFTALGKLISLLLVAGLITLGAYLVMQGRRAVRAGFTRGSGSPAALAPIHAAAHHVDAERDQAGDEQQRDELAERGEARRLLLGHRSGPISFDATGVV